MHTLSTKVKRIGLSLSKWKIKFMNASNISKIKLILTIVIADSTP